MWLDGCKIVGREKSEVETQVSPQRCRCHVTQVKRCHAAAEPRFEPPILDRNFAFSRIKRHFNINHRKHCEDHVTIQHPLPTAKTPPPRRIRIPHLPASKSPKNQPFEDGSQISLRAYHEGKYKIERGEIREYTRQ